jgi:hypothetical protein
MPPRRKLRRLLGGSSLAVCVLAALAVRLTVLGSGSVSGGALQQAKQTHTFSAAS